MSCESEKLLMKIKSGRNDFEYLIWLWDYSIYYSCNHTSYLTKDKHDWYNYLLSLKNRYRQPTNVILFDCVFVSEFNKTCVVEFEDTQDCRKPLKPFVS